MRIFIFTIFLAAVTAQRGYLVFDKGATEYIQPLTGTRILRQVHGPVSRDESGAESSIPSRPVIKPETDRTTRRPLSPSEQIVLRGVRRDFAELDNLWARYNWTRSFRR